MKKMLTHGAQWVLDKIGTMLSLLSFTYSKFEPTMKLSLQSTYDLRYVPQYHTLTHLRLPLPKIVINCLVTICAFTLTLCRLRRETEEDQSDLRSR
jgi:hypothetical protein